MPTKVTYRGENGPAWVPKSRRDVWNYAVRTGQVVVPPLANGGSLPDDRPFDPGDTFEIDWVPPEYAGRIREVAPPPQPTFFSLTDEPEDDDE